MCRLGLDSFGTGGVITKNDLDVIVVEDLESIGKNDCGVVSAIAVFRVGAADCHASLLRSFIPQPNVLWKFQAQSQPSCLRHSL